MYHPKTPGFGTSASAYIAGILCAVTPSVATVQVGKPAEEDLRNWGHHTSVHSVPDPVMQAVGQQHVTFIFSCQVGPFMHFKCISTRACTADAIAVMPVS